MFPKPKLKIKKTYYNLPNKKNLKKKNFFNMIN